MNWTGHSFHVPANVTVSLLVLDYAVATLPSLLCRRYPVVASPHRRYLVVATLSLLPYRRFTLLLMAPCHCSFLLHTESILIDSSTAVRLVDL